MKKSLNREKHLAQRRRGAEATNEIKQLFTSNLCAFASRREIVNFFTGSRYPLSLHFTLLARRPAQLAQPILTRQVANAGEFLFVVGHDRKTKRQRVSRDQHVMGAYGRARLLQTGA